MKKLPLFFAATWATKREQTWSGTCHSLFLSLSPHFEITDIDLPKEPLSRKILRKLAPSLFHDAGLSYVQSKGQFLKTALSTTKEGRDKKILFQLTDNISNNDKLSTYVFQDMSVSYLSYIAEHEKELFSYSGFGNYPLKSLQKRAAVERRYYDSCSGIFAMGQWFKDFLVSQGIDAKKVHAVGGGINLDEKLINPQAKQGNKILFLGRDFTRKGGEITYKAFVELKKQRPDLELHLAGPSENPIEDPVEGYFYHGPVNHLQAAELFNQCDIFCMPSYYEAFGLVFVEALCYGLPCIGRNCHEMPYIIQDHETGLILKEDSPEELSNLMNALLSDKSIHENVQNKRQEFLQKYSWKTIASRITEEITKVEEAITKVEEAYS